MAVVGVPWPGYRTAGVCPRETYPSIDSKTNYILKHCTVYRDKNNEFGALGAEEYTGKPSTNAKARYQFAQPRNPPGETTYKGGSLSNERNKAANQATQRVSIEFPTNGLGIAPVAMLRFARLLCTLNASL